MTRPDIMAKTTAIQASPPPRPAQGRIFQSMKPTFAAVTSHLKISRFGSSLRLKQRNMNQPRARRQRMVRMVWSTASGLLTDDVVGMAGAAEGGVVGDEALAIQVVEAVIHQGHALFDLYCKCLITYDT